MINDCAEGHSIVLFVGALLQEVNAVPEKPKKPQKQREWTPTNNGATGAHNAVRPSPSSGIKRPKKKQKTKNKNKIKKRQFDKKL
jgi:hypothetical protein